MNSSRGFALSGAVLVAACSGPPRNAVFTDARGRLALFAASSGGSEFRPSTVALAADGGVLFAGSSARELRLGSSVIHGGFAARLARDGSVRWARSVFSYESSYQSGRPFVLAGPYGGALLVGTFRGAPMAAGEAPAPWPLRLRAQLSLDEAGQRLYSHALEERAAEGLTESVDDVSSTALGDPLISLVRDEGRVVERHSGNNGSLIESLALTLPEGARPAPNDNPLLVASAGHHNGSHEGYYVSGYVPAGAALGPLRGHGGARETDTLRHALPTGAFVALVVPYEHRVQWARPAEGVVQQLVATREGAVIRLGERVSFLERADGSPRWSRTLPCTQGGPGRLQRVAAQRAGDAVIAVVSQDGGTCSHGSLTVGPSAANPTNRALVVHRLAVRDGSTEALALVGVRAVGGREFIESTLGVSDAAVDADGSPVLYGVFEGRIRVDSFETESWRGFESRCTHEDYTHRPDCGRLPFSHPALYVARPSWQR